MSSNIDISSYHMFIFFCGWYFFTIITYGTNVPSGLFLPGMIIGCAIGDLYSDFQRDINMFDLTKDQNFELRKYLIVIGCAATLAGYTRMTYSLGVIMMETSQTINIFVPVIFSIIISNQFGYVFTRSLYQRAVRGK